MTTTTNRTIKNTVVLAIVAAGLALGYVAMRPAHAHVSATRDAISTTIVEAPVVWVAPEVLQIPEITIYGQAPRAVTSVTCAHTENRLDGSVTSYECGNWGGHLAPKF